LGKAVLLIKVRAAVHLAFDHFDAVDVAFDGPRVVAQRHSIPDRVIVTPEPAANERNSGWLSVYTASTRRRADRRAWP
jgi:hypothetical protein